MLTVAFWVRFFGKKFLFQDLHINKLDSYVVLPGGFSYYYSTIAAKPPKPFFPIHRAGSFMIGLQSVAVMLLFFFGDHLSTPPFSFCVADSKASEPIISF